MKKTAIILLLSALYTSSHAQFNNASFLIGGQASYGSVNKSLSTYGANFKSGSIDLQFGKAVNNNTVVGITLHYDGQANGGGDPMYKITNKSRGYGFGIFGRKYKSIVKNLYFFGEVNAGYLYARQTSKSVSGLDDYSEDKTGGNISLMPGFAYNLSRRFQMELVLPNIVGASYTESNPKSPSGYRLKSSSFSIYSNLQSNFLNNLAVGFKFIL